MMEYKEEVIEFVESQRKRGRKLKDILSNLEISRSTYDYWKKTFSLPKDRSKRPFELTEMEKESILKTKNEFPSMRHRQIQGILQGRGVYLSPSSVYKVLKDNDLVEPFERRPSPLKKAQYEIWNKNIVWGLDWTKILIDGKRWHLITLIDFFSRMLLAFKIVPEANSELIQETYLDGLEFEEISEKSEKLPELRVDQGSPNTSLSTREFFRLMGAEISYARVNRPTDNAITERFYGTIKQEEIYLVGNYPDLQSAQQEIENYIDFYNYERPHQSLMNFTPFFIHNLNNKTEAQAILEEMKFNSRKRRMEYWSLIETVEMQKKLYPELMGGHILNLPEGCDQDGSIHGYERPGRSPQFKNSEISTY